MEELHQHKKALGTNKIQHRSKHRKTARETARYIAPVDPTHKGLSTSVKPMIQSLQRKSEHWLIRRMCLNCVGSTGVSTLDDPAKSKPIAGSVDQRDHKIEIQHTG